VKTALSLRQDKEPVRPFTKKVKSEKEDITAVIILDESSSMKDLLPQTIKLALLMSKLVESLNGKSMISGYNLQLTSFFGAGHFKIEQRIYKGFQDPASKAVENLACLKAEGGTPMADGVEFALNCLKGCPDKHQFIINITDGLPSHPLERLDDVQDKCNEQGVHLLAVGLGPECEYIKETFDHHVWSEESHDMVTECVKSIKKLLVGQ
jgi:nitric oxide reductase activation protein